MYARTQKTIREIRLKKLRKFEFFTAKFWHKETRSFCQSIKDGTKKRGELYRYFKQPVSKSLRKILLINY